MLQLMFSINLPLVIELYTKMKHFKKFKKGTYLKYLMDVNVVQLGNYN